METDISALEGLPRESMLTYAVLLGRQVRRNDPYALGAQITDLAVRGCLSIHESEHDIRDPILQTRACSDMVEEEEIFVDLLQDGCPPGSGTGVALKTLTSSKEFTNGMQTLWERVVMMHHTNYNKDRPLYNTDPTRSVRWQRAIRILGYTLAVGSVYAEPGWQGVVAGLAEILAAHEVPELLTTTVAGRALSSKVITLRRRMLRLADTGEVDGAATATHERALPFALLFDDDLKKKWPTFLGQHYQQYPSWLVPAQPATSKALRQEHIVAMLHATSMLCFPARKQGAGPL